MNNNLWVCKYGGSSLATVAQIDHVAKQLLAWHQDGRQLVVVVSAMGSTTNELESLAYQVAAQPDRRELDMLLTSGERIAMALLTLRLIALGVPAISFTGSQAGVLTSSSHGQAFIRDIRPHRVRAELAQNKVVVLAGFQGVDPDRKEVTTLGRGGSDTTAVALAACLNARACLILKDVPGVMCGDPRQMSSPRILKKITYRNLLDLTANGAKVLHARAAELAWRKRINLYFGLSSSGELGTQVVDEEQMEESYERTEVVGITSQDEVLRIRSAGGWSSVWRAITDLNSKSNLPMLTPLHLSMTNPQLRAYFSGTLELRTAWHEHLSQYQAGDAAGIETDLDWGSISIAVFGNLTGNMSLELLSDLHTKSISIADFFQSSTTITLIVEKSEVNHIVNELNHKYFKTI